jgi:hypothetical protein
MWGALAPTGDGFAEPPPRAASRPPSAFSVIVETRYELGADRTSAAFPSTRRIARRRYPHGSRCAARPTHPAPARSMIRRRRCRFRNQDRERIQIGSGTGVLGWKRPAESCAAGEDLHREVSRTAIGGDAAAPAALWDEKWLRTAASGIG